MYVQMFLVIIKEDRGMKKTLWNGKMQEWWWKVERGRARSNIHKDVKNCVIMDVWKGSRKKKRKDQGYFGETESWRG